MCFHGEPEADGGYADGGPAEHVGDADEAVGCVSEYFVVGKRKVRYTSVASSKVVLRRCS